MMIDHHPSECEEVLAAVQSSTFMLMGLVHVMLEILQRRAFLSGLANAPDDVLGVRSHVGRDALLIWPLGSSSGIRNCISACMVPIFCAILLWDARSIAPELGGFYPPASMSKNTWPPSNKYSC